MKYVVNILLLISSLTSISQAMQLGDENTKPIGQKYFEYLSQVQKNGAAQGAEILSPIVKKVVNSRILCTSRDQAIKQLQELVDTYGIKKIELLKIAIGADSRENYIRFEITYDDQSVDTVASFLTCDDEGRIKEINQVYGEKGAFDWQPK